MILACIFSLPFVRYIANTSQGAKVLIIADPRMIFTLYRSIISIGLQPHHFDRAGTHLSQWQQIQQQQQQQQQLRSAVRACLLGCQVLLTTTTYLHTWPFPCDLFSTVIQLAPMSGEAGASGVAAQEQQ